MGWTTPSDRTTGFLVTAAVYNADVIDNLKYLHGSAPGVRSVTQIFNGTTTYTVPSSPTATALVIEAVGAGGGGSGCPASGAGSISVGVGGGGGAYASKFYNGANIGTHTVAVGLGGGGGAAGAFNGGNGGSTTFADSLGASLLTAVGGPLGSLRQAGVGIVAVNATDRSSSTGDAVNAGGGSMALNSSTTFGFCEAGGSGWGGGGVRVVVNATASGSAGVVPTTLGGGGTGGIDTNTTARAGASGANGVMLVTAYG